MKRLASKISPVKIITVAIAVCVSAFALVFSNVAWHGIVPVILGIVLVLIPNNLLSILGIVLVTVGLEAAEYLLSGKYSTGFALMLLVLVLCKELLNRAEQNEKAHKARYAYQDRVIKQQSLVNEIAQLRNMRSYKNDAAIYLRLCERYNLNLSFIIWHLDNAELLTANLKEREWQTIVQEMARILSTNIRTEDMIYALDSRFNRVTWGSLHIANDENVCQVVEARVRKAISEMILPSGVELKLTVKYSSAQDGMTPLTLLECGQKAFGDQLKDLDLTVYDEEK